MPRLPPQRLLRLRRRARPISPSPCASPCAICAAASGASASSSPASRSASRPSRASAPWRGRSSDGLASQGRLILGGDVAASLLQREATPEELAFLKARGQVTSVATMRAMARTLDGRSALVEPKAVDANYPSRRHARHASRRCRPAELFADRNGAFGAVADGALFSRLRPQGRRPRAARRRHARTARAAGIRAGQAGGGHQFRSAHPAEPGRAARQRPAAARQPGAVDLSPVAARQRVRRRGADPLHARI